MNPLSTGFIQNKVVSFRKAFPDGANIAIVILGVVFRLRHYLQNRSFWMDEAWMARNLSIRTFGDIFSGRVFATDLPTPPLGFSLIEKALITIFPENELTFRLFPFLCGVASLVLLYVLLKRSAGREGVPLALMIFACAGLPIYYSAELRRYSCEIAVAISLYLIKPVIDDGEMSDRRVFWYGMAGIAALSLSYASVFILAGIGITQTVREASRRNWLKLKKLTFAYYIWFGYFVLTFFMYCSYLFGNATVQEAFSPFYMPGPVWMPETWIWFGKSAVQLIRDASGMRPFLFGLYFVLIGCHSLWRKDREKLCALLCPIALAFFAAAIQRYLITGRYLLLFAPAVLVIFAEGAVTGLRSKNRNVAAVHAVLLAVMMVFSVFHAGRYFLGAYKKEEIRPLMRVLKQERQKGDGVIMNNSAHYAYGYYLEHFDLDDKTRTVLKITDKVLEDEQGKYVLVKPLYFMFTVHGRLMMFHKQDDVSWAADGARQPFGDHPRTWVLFSHYKEETKQFVLDLLERGGKRLKMVEEEGSELYLYDLSGAR